MLSPRYLEGLSDEIVEIYAQLEADILQDMARRIARLGKVTEATKWQAQLLAEAGALKKNVNRYIKKYDPAIQKEIDAIYNDALIKNARADNRIFTEALGHGVSDINAQVMLASIKKTHSDLSRLTITTAYTTEQQFVQQANAAYMQVATGAFDYDTATKNACNNLARDGVSIVQYMNGKPVRRSIEAAVRMNVLTGVNQTASAVTMANCEELGCDLVETTAHIGARPSHEDWQGQIFSLSGTNPKYRPFSVCGLGEPDGICGINCRHSYYPYFEGLERHYTQQDLDDMENVTVEYNGQKLSRYDAEQKLRGMERNIRKYKRQALTQEAAGIDNTAARVKIGEWQAAARDFTQQTKLERDRVREFIGTADGKQPSGIKPKVTPVKTLPMQTVTPAANVTQFTPPADMNAKAATFYGSTNNLQSFVEAADNTQTITTVKASPIVEGKNLAGQIQVKPALQDINEVLKKQGFDGLPQVVSKDDFIKAVNDDTFVAQRTYTAPDKKTLDSYIDMLRNSDFYVDCRTGGRAHGKGMYAAADYSKGNDLRRVVNEMVHYQKIGATQRGEQWTQTETLTLIPNAKIIDEAEIKKQFIFSFSQYYKGRGFTQRQINDKIIAEGWLNRDVGVLAAIMGYDAIRAVPSVNRADYMVILNRTKLILLGG